MIKSHRLANGLNVVTVTQHDTAAVTVMVLIPVGSRYETKTNNGISHFLEHLMFKGTTRRPTTLDISKALDSVGAEYNAYTAKDHTLYYIKLANQHTELALDLLSDMLFHSVFDPKEIERERGVIVEEINMYQDNPLMHLDTVLEMGVFGEHHPLGYDIAGPKPNITHLPRQAFFRFMQQHYRPSTMQLVIAGNVPHNTLALARRYFGNYTQPHRRLRPKPFSQSQRQSTIVYRHKDTQQTQLGLGLVAYPYHHPWLPAAQVLAIILGGNMSSRLFIRVRERQGLCYSIHAEASSYTDTGIFSIQAGVDNQRINQAITAISTELQLLKKDLVTSEELHSAQEFIKGQLALRLEDSSAVASWYGRQAVLTGKLISPTVKLKQIAKVDRQLVRRVARQLFRPGNLTLASIGPQRIKQPSILTTVS